MWSRNSERERITTVSNNNTYHIRQVAIATILNILQLCVNYTCDMRSTLLNIRGLFLFYFSLAAVAFLSSHLVFFILYIFVGLLLVVLISVGACYTFFLYSIAELTRPLSNSNTKTAQHKIHAQLQFIN